MVKNKKGKNVEYLICATIVFVGFYIGFHFSKHVERKRMLKALRVPEGRKTEKKIEEQV